MIIVFDIGNTNITVGIYKNDVLIATQRLNTNATKEVYKEAYLSFCDKNKISEKGIAYAVIGSVVPSATEKITEILNEFSVKIFTVTPNIKLNFKLNIPNPEIVGADLIAGCAEVADKYRVPSIIFDIGTALTACVLDENKNFISCFITPGPNLSLKALSQNCALLPMIDLNAPVEYFPNNTEACIRSGIILSYASTIDGLSSRMQKIMRQKLTTIATGGLSKMIVRECKIDIVYKENLLLDGLNTLFKMNK